MDNSSLITKTDTLRQNWLRQDTFTQKQRTVYYRNLELNYESLREYSEQKDILFNKIIDQISQQTPKADSENR